MVNVSTFFLHGKSSSLSILLLLYFSLFLYIIWLTVVFPTRPTYQLVLKICYRCCLQYNSIFSLEWCPWTWPLHRIEKDNIILNYRYIELLINMPRKGMKQQLYVNKEKYFLYFMHCICSLSCIRYRCFTVTLLRQALQRNGNKTV